MKDDKKDNKKTENKGDKKQAATADTIPENAIIIDNSKVKYLIDIHNEASAGSIFGIKFYILKN
jgi:hypothetical protein